jgi:hypothetical protein
MPTVMFVGEEKGSVREGGFTGMAVFVTVTMKLVLAP